MAFVKSDPNPLAVIVEQLSPKEISAMLLLVCPGMPHAPVVAAVVDEEEDEPPTCQHRSPQKWIYAYMELNFASSFRGTSSGSTACMNSVCKSGGETGSPTIARALQAHSRSWPQLDGIRDSCLDTSLYRSHTSHTPAFDADIIVLQHKQRPTYHEDSFVSAFDVSDF